MATIDGLPPLRDVIRDHELVAKKQLGQNFLLDLNLTAKIARAAGDLSGADVLEVGPGPGGLTRGLLAEGARRMMIELPVADTVPGALVLFRMRPGAIAKHVGILTAPTRFIHAYERLGVIEEPLTSAWRRRIAFVFLFPIL